uniref:pleckstrin homology domain-containing family A member 1-like isoform X2 n=1 Tax=Myxine glutinosa TaxID=7769 RepID=UPI00358F8761
MPYVDRQGRICGFLDIEDTENSGKFLRRYFILDSKANGLYWFMDNPQNLPDGASHVGHLELAYVNKVSDATKIRPKAEFCFVINSGMQRYFLQANDQQDLTDWVDALNNASKITVPRPESNNDPGDCLHSKTNSSCQPPQSCAYRTQIVGGVAMQVPVSPEDAASEVVPAEAAQNVLLYCLQNNSPQLDAQAAHGPGQPIKTGYCVKQGGMMKNWKQRYFVLSENAISYYKSDCERDPQRTISLRDVRSAREFDLSVRTSELLRRDNLFEIVTPNRTFFVQAPSPEEMHSWIKAISAAIVAQRGPARSTASIRHSRQLGRPFGLRRSLHLWAHSLSLSTTETMACAMTGLGAVGVQVGGEMEVQVLSTAADPAPTFGSRLLPLHKHMQGKRAACASAVPSFADFDFGSFSHSSLQICSSPVKLDEERR